MATIFPSSLREEVAQPKGSLKLMGGMAAPGCGPLAFSLRERYVCPLPSAQCPDPNAQPLRKHSDQCESIQRSTQRAHTTVREARGHSNNI